MTLLSIFPDPEESQVYLFVICILFRDLPRALMIGIPLVTIVYLLTNIAYIAVVGGKTILTAGAVAMVSCYEHTL